MSKKSRQSFKRANTGIDPHKHEDPQMRAERHERAVASSREQHGQQQHRQFDVASWDRMHAEAENATLFQGRRAVHVPGMLVRP